MAVLIKDSNVKRGVFAALSEATKEIDLVHGRMLACTGAFEGTPSEAVLRTGMAHISAARRLIIEAIRLVEDAPIYVPVETQASKPEATQADAVPAVGAAAALTSKK